MVMSALSIALFMFKEKIIPDQNAAYREELSRYVKTSAVVVFQRDGGWSPPFAPVGYGAVQRQYGRTSNRNSQ